jgi:hypothetical protein
MQTSHLFGCIERAWRKNRAGVTFLSISTLLSLPLPGQNQTLCSAGEIIQEVSIKPRSISEMTPYPIVCYFRPESMELWSKVVHYIGSRVPFRMQLMKSYKRRRSSAANNFSHISLPAPALCTINLDVESVTQAAPHTFGEQRLFLLPMI